MEATHSVSNVNFHVSFDTEAAAFAAQAELRRLVSGRFIEVLDEVLRRWSFPDDRVVKIDRLEIDLGRLAATSYYEEAERRFRDRLNETLGRTLAALTGEAESGHTTARVISRTQTELETIAWFLETGSLPWNFRDASRRTLEEMLRRVLRESGPLLAARFESARAGDAVVNRLTWQFPPELIVELSGLLRPDSDGESPLPEESAEQERLLEKAIVTGEESWIAPAWAMLVIKRPELIEEVVRTQGLRAEVRRLMARGFPDAMLGDIAGILEPAEIDFIEELTGRTDIFKQATEEADNRGRAESPSALKSRLWEFTFTHLLVERGGDFNRRSYLASVLRQMAAHENISCRTLLAALSAILDRVEVHSRLRDEMLALLSHLAVEHEDEGVPDPVPPGFTTGESLLTKALISGDSRPIRRYWPAMVRDDRETVERVVMSLGVHAAVRRSMARGFPEPMRRDIAQLLEPSESRFIGRLVDNSQLFRDAGQHCGAQLDSLPEVKSRLWELTFAWLLTQRGSRFNRRAYVGDVVRRMAAHDNLKYDDLLAAMVNGLERVEVASDLKEEMRSLLSEMRAPEAGSREAAGDVAVERIVVWEDLLEEALTSGDPEILSGVWSMLLRSHRGDVARIVRRRGIRPDVRSAMARGFGEPMLRDIATILWPSGISMIEEFVAAPGLFGEAIGERSGGGSELKSRLWEYTLAYLLSGRGVFSKRTYAAGAVRTLAAQHNIPYETLANSLAAAADRSQVSEPLKYEIHALAGSIPAAHTAVLEEALLSGNAQAIATLWPNFLGSDRSSALRTMRSPSMRPEVWKSVASGFPEVMLRDIVELVEPGAVNFIAGFVQHAADVKIRRQLWEFTLIFLLAGWGGRFRREAYLSAMVQQLAASNHATVSDLLPSLVVKMERLPARDAATRELVRLLRKQAATFGSPGEAIRSCEVYDILSDCLLRGAALPAAGVAGLIDEIVRKYPQQLARLLREWGALGAGNLTQLQDLAADAVHISRNRTDYRLMLARLLRERPLGRCAGPEEAEAMEPQRIGHALAHASELSAADRARLIRALDRFAGEPREEFLNLLRTGPRAAELWAGIAGVLPERQLATMMRRLAGGAWHRCLMSANSLVNSASAGGLGPPPRLQKIKWRFLFEYLIQAGRSASEREFARRFHKRLVVGAPARAAKAPKPRPAKKDRPLKEDNRNDIYIRNAGLVLATPYLPRLFEMLGLLEGKVFRNAECAGRAAHLLQYMVDVSIDPPEHLLTLNKILCGLEPEAAVMRVIDVTQAEKNAIDGLLQAVITHWTKLGNTSVQGLRESFLQRDGRLRLKDDAWRLLVGARAFDMLLDGLPWSFSVIRHPWMKRTLYVEWR